MIEIWIPITIIAAFSQNLRSIFQKKLQENLSNIGATYVRFAYGLPFVIIYFFIVNNFSEDYLSINEINLEFMLYCTIGGVSQIIATFLLLKIFVTSNFAVGTVYSKTEPIQAAFFGFILLNEMITLIGFLGILIGLVGIIITAFSKINKTYSFFSSTVLLGLLSGTLFGLSAVMFRGASHSLYTYNFLLSSAFTLLIAISIQTIILTFYIYFTDIKQFHLILVNWKQSVIVGLFGAVASLCWFYAMSIQNVAYVRALGQIELIFTIFASIFYFKEKFKFAELLGIVITLIGILIILVYV
ncbi:MAG: EamA family transporter [Pelagibacterales bacterium]|nr:EamA family transporter [Pelagibacterales bacterium]